MNIFEIIFKAKGIEPTYNVEVIEQGNNSIVSETWIIDPNDTLTGLTLAVGMTTLFHGNSKAVASEYTIQTRNTTKTYTNNNIVEALRKVL